MVKASKWLRSLLAGKKEAAPDEQDKASSRRRWSFARSKTARSTATSPAAFPESETSHQASEQDLNCDLVGPQQNEYLEEIEKEHSIAVAAASAAAAKAAVAAANAAALAAWLTSIRLTGFHEGTTLQEVAAAVKIQAVFRGYLGRRAGRALRSLVKLQALVRGYIVRQQTATTLRGMQALVSLQAQARVRRTLKSEKGEAFLRQVLQRSRHAQKFGTRPRSSMDGRNQRGIKGTTNDLINSSSYLSMNNDSLEHYVSDGYTEQQYRRSSRLDRWMAARQWENQGLEEMTLPEDCKAKIVEMDPGHPRRRNDSMSEAGSISMSIPAGALATATVGPLVQIRGSWATERRLSLPVPASEGNSCAEVLVGKNSLRMIPDDGSMISAVESSARFSGRRSTYGAPESCPSYMASTESAKARVRSESAPKQRPADPLPGAVPSINGKSKRLSFQDGRGGGGAFVTAAAAARIRRSSWEQQKHRLQPGF